MKKQYGIFEINTKSRYLSEGLDSIQFLSERYLHDSEEDALRWFPAYDGHFIVLPIYITDEQKKWEEESLYRKQFFDSWSKAIKDKEESELVNKIDGKPKLSSEDITKPSKLNLRYIKL